MALREKVFLDFLNGLKVVVLGQEVTGISIEIFDFVIWFL